MQQAVELGVMTTLRPKFNKWIEKKMETMKEAKDESMNAHQEAEKYKSKLKYF